MFVEQLSPLRSWGRDFPFLPFLPSLYPEWPQPAQHGGDRRQSTGESPREMGRGRWGGLSPSVLRGFQPLLPPEGPRLWGPSAFHLCPSDKVTV